MTLVAQAMSLSISIVEACAPVRPCRFCIALESDCYFESIWVKTLVIRLSKIAYSLHGSLSHTELRLIYLFFQLVRAFQSNSIVIESYILSHLALASRSRSIYTVDTLCTGTRPL